MFDSFLNVRTSGFANSYDVAPGSLFSDVSLLKVFLFLSFFLICFILLFRLVVLWYFRINKIVALLEDIRDNLTIQKNSDETGETKKPL